jgi:hypothetical protein
MRYNEIVVERQQQRTEIMYHGTSSKLVPSILKNGLLARPPRKTYDVDTFGASTASMGGVYVADEKEFAIMIAKEAIETHGGEPALVTIQYVKGSGDIDEDDVVAAVSDAAKTVMKRLSQKAPAQYNIPDFLPRHLVKKWQAENPQPLSKYSSLSYPAEGWATDQMIQKANSAAEKIADQTVEILSKHSKPSRAARDVLKSIAVKLLEYAGQYDEPRERWNAVAFEAFDIVRENMEELLGKLMRQVNPDTPEKSAGTRRIDRDVKFKGKTRILKIESPIGNIVYPKQTT